MRKKRFNLIKWHPIMARATIVLGVLHGAMGLATYL